jgi:type III restriction enzyme
MPSPVNIGTREIPLSFVKKLTEIVNTEWDNKTYLEKVTPVTRELLRFWFEDAFCENRVINFHSGQKQAILNTIYVHEILKTSTVFDTWAMVDSELLAQMDLVDLKKEKYQYPKYAVKMATGTGKTWVIEAFLIWQYLNARHEESYSGRFSKNFLLVAPGLIIYERLLNAFSGKENEQGVRDFERSDFRQFESLFIPPAYKDEILGFLQSGVCGKEEIGRKVTGDGLIAITNWHLLAGVEEEEELESSPLENPSRIIKDILPISPGTSAGHSLDSLDSRYLSGNEIEFLARLKDLVVINDEAHHIHENKKYGEVVEVEWQKSLNYIAQGKKEHFIQIDFSATPYDVTGGGQKRTKHYFPHIVVDFDLRAAIYKGLVKTIVLDKRKEIASIPLEALDFKAERGAGGEIIGLSSGQKIMLRAGLAKLRVLEEHFVDLTKNKEGVSYKHPKMFVICEDTKVTPKVEEYLVVNEGLSPDDVMRIDSGKKETLSDKEWNELKPKLFDIDKHSSPKVIVSVLMLREGFDVNNICVVVPLRTSAAPILLEQTVGRGLRLMWREPEFRETRDENIELLLKKKKEPKNYIDILSIIEHPAFIRFYDDLISDVTIVEDVPKDKSDVLGDIINVGLKDNFRDYDLFWPLILVDKEENLVPMEISIDKMSSFDLYGLEQLKKMVPKGGDVFYSEEITVKTRFGDYEVRPDIFNSQSYNEFIGKIVRAVTNIVVKVGVRKQKHFPVMQIHQDKIAGAIDDFVRNKLFKFYFDPFTDNNWRVLLLAQSGIGEHIIKEISKVIYELQTNIDVSEAQVIKKWFSEVDSLRMRQKYCLDIEKTIYRQQAYPSNKGELEKNFMEFCDTDSDVEAFIKINEHYHNFAQINYVRADGMFVSYSPDFLVRSKEKMYIVETKGQEYLGNENVNLKQLATVDWIERINELRPEDRMNVVWKYVLLGEKTFYILCEKGAFLSEIFEYADVTKNKIEGTLFSK